MYTKDEHGLRKSEDTGVVYNKLGRVVIFRALCVREMLGF